MKNLSKIEEIYHAALKLTPEGREEFLRQNCGDDLDLRREVESLLAFQEKAESFIESPPEDLAEDFFSHRTDQDIIGKTLNHYKVLSLLGAGGMGEVYLAEDKILGRKIAIKLLPAKFSENEERKGRFLREARAVSALNHPNIITVFGIKDAEGLEFIVTEFIDGRTVYEKLTGDSFDWREVIEIAIQLTDALESAHRIGIIHRDLKPANIMIRKDGYVKILDFGLAKMLDETPDAKVFKTTEISKAHRVMGTMNYMSPEQALGKELDARSDIFSLGIMLYEMLSGVQPFKGTSDAAVYNAILNSDPPPLSELRSDLPPALEQIIRLAIEKDRDSRYQSISDMQTDLQILKENSASDHSNGTSNNYSFSGSNGSGRTKILAPVAAAVAAILVSVAAIYVISNYNFSDPETKLGNLSHKQLTSESGEELFPNLSPDGKTFIYSSGEEGKRDIYFQRVGGSNPINLTNDPTSDDIQAVYSPDGESIAFNSKRDGGVGLYLMGATGESVRRLADLGFNPSWSPDGTEIVYSTEGFTDPVSLSPAGKLFVVNIETGTKRPVRTKGVSLQPNWSPNGNRIAFWEFNQAGNRNIKTISASGGEPFAVTDDAFLDWNPVWSADGKYLYFLSNRGGSMNLWRVPIEEKTGKTLGEPEPVTVPSNRIRYLNFSRDGKSFIYNQTTISTNIFKVGFDPDSETVGETAIQITKGNKHQTNPDVSDDNTKLVFGNIGDTQEDIFIADADGSNLRNLTNNADRDRGPRLSPDGKRVAFFSDTTGRYEGWIIDADGGNLRMLTKTSSELWAQLPVWSPDGERILYNSSKGFPFFYDPDKDAGQQTPTELPHDTTSPDSYFVYSWSPDGKKLAGYAYDGDETEDFVTTFDFTTNKYKELDIIGYCPFWVADSQRLVLFNKSKIYLVDTKTNRKKELLSVSPKTIHSIFLTKDSRSIYYSLNNRESDIWMATIEE